MYMYQSIFIVVENNGGPNQMFCCQQLDDFLKHVKKGKNGTLML